MLLLLPLYLFVAVHATYSQPESNTPLPGLKPRTISVSTPHVKPVSILHPAVVVANSSVDDRFMSVPGKTADVQERGTNNIMWWESDTIRAASPVPFSS